MLNHGYLHIFPLLPLPRLMDHFPTSYRTLQQNILVKKRDETHIKFYGATQRHKFNFFQMFFCHYHSDFLQRVLMQFCWAGAFQSQWKAQSGSFDSYNEALKGKNRIEIIQSVLIEARNSANLLCTAFYLFMEALLSI